MPSALDAIDMKILELMQRDASLSTGELAERVGLSQSPCWRRIQRMREEGYIKGIVAIVDAELVGFKMQIFAQVKMARLTSEERAAFHKAVNAQPEILECWTVFGEMDVMMKILAPDVSWYQDFIFNILLRLPGVEDVRSIVALGAQKSSLAVPLVARQYR
jgi:Lrp/AsnC family transcriptional regulator